MNQPRLRAAAAVACLLLASCSLLEPRPDRTRFYVLASIEDTGAEPHRDLSVGVGPINLPDYLQRQEVIVRTGPTEVQSAPLARWAGALESNVGRAMGENLARLLGTDRVWSYPSYEIARTRYLVDVNFVRFELDERNTARLIARWQVRDQTNGRVTSRETDAAVPASSSDVGDGVAALSQALGDLTRELAAAIVALDGSIAEPRP